MSQTFSFADSLSLGDLRTFLGRASRVEDGSVRLIAGSGVLAVYVAVLYPAGLLDDSPTVLGLRTFAIGTKDSFDVVVPLGSLIERLARLAAGIAEPAGPVSAAAVPAAAVPAAVVQVTLPMEVNTMTWAAISPPRGGWRSVGEADGDRLEFVAKAGIEEIATEIPTGTGEQIVHRVRAEVWGRPIDGVEHVPAGGAFAAVSLGFLRAGDPVKVYETGPWTRLSTQHGHVLIKRRAWTLQR